MSVHRNSFIGGDYSFPNTSSVTQPAQVQAHLEFLDELLAVCGLETTVLLVGHGVGESPLCYCVAPSPMPWCIHAIYRDIRRSQQSRCQHIVVPSMHSSDAPPSFPSLYPVCSHMSHCSRNTVPIGFSASLSL